MKILIFELNLYKMENNNILLYFLWKTSVIATLNLITKFLDAMGFI